jgi:hypothetical protein
MNTVESGGLQYLPTFIQRHVTIASTGSEADHASLVTVRKD